MYLRCFVICESLLCHTTCLRWSSYKVVIFKLILNHFKVTKVASYTIERTQRVLHIRFLMPIKIIQSNTRFLTFMTPTVFQLYLMMAVLRTIPYILIVLAKSVVCHRCLLSSSSRSCILSFFRLGADDGRHANNYFVFFVVCSQQWIQVRVCVAQLG